MLKNCEGGKIVKRFIDNQNNTTDDSFQVNVSAGYGVHSENTTLTSPSPVYNFQERKTQRENDSVVQMKQDQISQPSQTVIDVLPTPSYQVHEKIPEVQEKNFHVLKNHRHRSVEKRVRTRNNEIRKGVNDVEYKEPVRHQQGKLAAGTKIVEVLRVPAMYELHLQSDPQRLATLNTAWLTKLNNLMNQSHQYKRPVMQPFYQYGGGKNNFAQQQSASTNFVQTVPGNNVPHQRLGNNLQNLRLRLLNQKPNGYSQQVGKPFGAGQPKVISHPVQQTQSTQNIGFKHNYLLTQSYPNSYQNIQASVSPSEAPKKASPALPVQNNLNYQQLSNEIPADYYQKPQALHEVPAPVLNKQSYKQTLPKSKATSVPNLVYGKPIDITYQPVTQPSAAVPALWTGNNLQDQSNQNGGIPDYQYNKGQVDPVPNYHQQYQSDKLQYQSGKLNNVGTNGASGDYPSYQPQYKFNTQHYQGYQNPQNYYNDAIGDYLDQSLMNVNGGVSTFMNHDGSMTVSNFHHNPKLYRPPVDYEIPASEPPKMEDMAADIGGGLSPYANENSDLTNFNNQLYSNFAQEIPVTEPSIETADNQGYADPNADLANLLLGAARSGVEEAPNQKFEPTRGYGRARITRRMYPRPFSSNRRMEPMDYILYIKERTLD